MVKKILLSLLLCAATGFLFAAEAKEVQIDTSILDKAYTETYINDTSVISWRHYSTGKQIRDMGRRLGAEIKYQEQVNHADSPYASGSPDFKYKAVRIYPGTKAGADVIYVEKHASVNTIQNMRRIVSGYIERAYDIPMDKADQIAKKVCYWNTNHYDDKGYFKANFQVRVREVFANKTPVIGLARSYKNWPGKTRIVIPFVLIKEAVPEAVEPAPQPAVTETAPAPAPEVAAPAPEPETPAPAPVQSEETEQKAGLPALTIILIIILIIALIVLAAVLVKRAMDKKKEEENGNK